MEKPEHHIFVCMSFRAWSPRASASRKTPPSCWAIWNRNWRTRGMDNVMVSTTGCLKLCDHGPIAVVYPEGYWYQNVEGEDAIDAILDGLENGGPAKEYLVD